VWEGRGREDLLLRTFKSQLIEMRPALKLIFKKTMKMMFILNTLEEKTILKYFVRYFHV
jgi:hypothetical protein